MQQQIHMQASVRQERGKNAARRLRAAGNVPAVIYGLGRDPQAVTLDTKAITKVLEQPSGRNRVFELDVEGAPQHAMAVDYQIDPVQHSLLHVDMQRIELTQSVRVSIPVQSVGSAYGVKNEGGFEEMVNRQVHIECLPLDIPEHIEVDVSALHVGQSIRVRDIPHSDKYRVADDEHKLLLHIMASRASGETEATADEGETADQSQAD